MGCTESKHDEGQNSFVHHLQRRNNENDNVEHPSEDGASENSSVWVKVWIWIPDSKETLELRMVEPTDTIQDLKNQINRQKGYPEENQSLWLGEMELRHNYHTVSDYQINAHSLLELRLVKAAGQGENEIKLFGGTSDGIFFEWCVDDESTTILALKHCENVIASNPKLRSLEINFRSTRITDLTAIINSVNTLERLEVFKLEVFKLDVGFNGQIAEIGWDANSTTPLASCLRKLTIIFQYSDQLMEASIKRFFKTLRHYSKLGELRLTFQESTSLTSLASLANSIRNLPLLEVVYFNFAECPKLGDKEVVRFCRSLTGMSFTFKELSFRESCSEKLSDALKTIKTIPDLQNALLETADI
eukprot:scaffold551751_cov39-Attheya_sp.AAC.1